VEESVAKLKANLTSKDYKAVVLGAPSVAASVTSLKDTVAKKKADLATVMAAAQEEWAELSTSVPQMIEAIQSRVDTLSKSRRLPNNLDKATFETVKTDFDALKADWTAAGSQFASGAAADAVRTARAAKTKGEEILVKLGMKS
jgi:hypothetical protein